jgi:hypothetical protein
MEKTGKLKSTKSGPLHFKLPIFYHICDKLHFCCYFLLAILAGQAASLANMNMKDTKNIFSHSNDTKIITSQIWGRKHVHACVCVCVCVWGGGNLKSC